MQAGEGGRQRIGRESGSQARGERIRDRVANCACVCSCGRQARIRIRTGGAALRAVSVALVPGEKIALGLALGAVCCGGRVGRGLCRTGEGARSRRCGKVGDVWTVYSNRWPASLAERVVGEAGPDGAGAGRVRLCQVWADVGMWMGWGQSWWIWLAVWCGWTGGMGLGGRSGTGRCRGGECRAREPHCRGQQLRV